MLYEMGPQMNYLDRQTRIARKQRIQAQSISESCFDCSTKQDDCLPKFRTSVLMIQKMGNIERKLGVVLSIYATSYDLYAVVSLDRNIIVKDCGYIKLKNCIVTTDMTKQTLEIIQKNFEGVPLRFKVCKKEHLEELIDLLNLNNEEGASSDSELPLPVSSNPTTSQPFVHPAVKKFIHSSSPVTRSPRVSPNTKRKLSMPVLAEDEEREELEHHTQTLVETAYDSEE